MRDPYEVLGVRPQSSADEIKTAYRRLAKQLHPDLHPGDDKAGQRFKEVTAAYDMLSDTDKRARYDRGEIDPSGAPKRHGFQSRRSGGGARPGGGAREDGVDVEDILSEIFRNRRSTGARTGGWGFGGRRPGAGKPEPEERDGDVRVGLRVPFVDTITGGKRQLALTSGKTVNVTIAPGIVSGQILRLKGQGSPAEGGRPAGDALVEIEVEPHPVLTRSGRDIRVELPVTLGEALLGAAVTVPTAYGAVTLRIPKGSNSGTTLRLRGKGVAAEGDQPAGDQYVTLAVHLPESVDDELAEFVERWSAAHPYDPRRTRGFD